ncbi:TrmJ/YjtD family RNA methyltransferase [Methanobrevibacter cuticularis]|uniref:TrmJ/YjtD family RNA methyltransferase n=1 Tax=Methanobrevibacter cuticularis TaxID=47311 RepID=UPI000830E1AE|nr:TrmJ/YjtD family RNA methyltransferase [Methanobrevibacter cuticularis]
MVYIGDIASSERIIIKESTTSVAEEKKEEKTEATAKGAKSSKKRGVCTGHGLRFSKNYDRLEKNIFIVFVECESSGNVGFLGRTMANFGLKNLVLINPCELEKEAYYQAMHGKSIVETATTYDSLEEFFKKEEIEFIIGSTGTPGGSYNLSRIPIKPEELGKSINLNRKIAILFGREGNGLYNKEIELCDIIVSIPTDPSYPIMNISHAAAIVFYEIFKNRNEFPVEGLEEATAIEKKHLLKDMQEIIKKLGIPKHKEKTGLKSFKNIVNRAFITGREVHTLKGIFRKINKKL